MIDDNSKEFIYRHIGPSENEQAKMLEAVGYKTLDDLMKNTVPEKILLKEELKIDTPLSENDALKKLNLFQKNEIFRNFIGMGYYNSFTPNVILKYFGKSWLVYFIHTLSTRSCSRSFRDAFEFSTINNRFDRNGYC